MQLLISPPMAGIEFFLDELGIPRESRGNEIIYKHGSFLPEDKIEELKKESLSGLLPGIRKTDEGFVALRKRRKTEDFNYGGASGDSGEKG